MSRVITGLLFLSLSFSLAVTAVVFKNQNQDDREAEISVACESEPSCQALIKNASSSELAKEFYQKAFQSGLVGDFQEAKIYSKCSACLTNGTQTWTYSAENFFK